MAHFYKFFQLLQTVHATKWSFPSGPDWLVVTPVLLQKSRLREDNSHCDPDVVTLLALLLLFYTLETSVWNWKLQITFLMAWGNQCYHGVTHFWAAGLGFNPEPSCCNLFSSQCCTFDQTTIFPPHCGCRDDVDSLYWCRSGIAVPPFSVRIRYIPAQMNVHRSCTCTVDRMRLRNRVLLRRLHKAISEGGRVLECKCYDSGSGSGSIQAAWPTRA